MAQFLFQASRYVGMHKVETDHNMIFIGHNMILDLSGDFERRNC